MTVCGILMGVSLIIPCFDCVLLTSLGQHSTILERLSRIGYEAISNV